jgi:putative endopeptidase
VRLDPRVGGLSRDQNFFLNWATIWRAKVTPELERMLLTTDPHAPARCHVIGPPSNLEAYAAAFGCKAGEPMVRSGDKQVHIW